MSICKNCGEQTFDADDQVCTSCGVVDESCIKFQTEVYSTSYRFKPYEPYSRKSRPEALEHGLTTLNHLCHQLAICQDVKAEAAALLTSIYRYRKDSGKSFRLKEDLAILSGCCLMQIKDKNRYSISLSSVAKVLKCSRKRAYKMLKLVRAYLTEHDVNRYSESNKGNVEDHDKEFSELLHTDISNLLSTYPENDKKELIERTVSLVELAKSCWLLTGRSRIGVFSASAYLCWRSLHPGNKLSLKKFCSQYFLDYKRSTLRVRELRHMLLKLSANIPSATKNYVTEKNLVYHIGYILENSESLRNDLLTNEFTGEDMAMKEFDNFRRCFLKSKPPIKSACRYDDDMNASDVEISDTEISSYIKTEQQRNLYINLKSLESSSNASR